MSNIGIQVGHEKESVTITEVANAIRAIMDTGFDNHADQTTIQTAINAFNDAVQIRDTTISNCSVHQDLWED